MSQTKTMPLNKAVMFSPSGALIDEALLDRACVQLQNLGFSISEIPQARQRAQRFAGTEAERIHGIKQAIEFEEPALLMATRGGYGLSRLLPLLSFTELATQLNANRHVLCGHSDITSLQLALLHAGAKPESLLHGPMACFDFGAEQGADPLTSNHFLSAVKGKQVEIDWQAEGFGVAKIANCEIDELHIEGPVWGGNLTLLCSLVGTPWLPTMPGGILVLEDVNEPAYKIERMLLQLLHSGVLAQQNAVVLGNFCEPKPGVHDNGYNLASAAEFVQNQMGRVPLLMNFPFGHCTPKACWFQGGTGQLTLSNEMAARLTQNLS
ncbi:LD-carboxypeptidase [Limnobacter parvus]|uniref:LD-carboxypeptidase n=1 Tax=Limnobacter parvus TaxID=2939690 RepID=A0ABT1XI37_9BURK|nr:LD-carboxypeptidase [Limnobacter parvus]MCR2746950.1 LD-carboxypeptidase [Limnobacter parvus]